MGNIHPIAHYWVIPGFSDQIQAHFLPLTYPVISLPMKGVDSWGIP